MGDPKKPKKKYSKPSHPWQGGRIEEEKQILRDYGLKNKTEIWKVLSLVKSFKQQAKNIIASSSKQAELEGNLLLKKLAKLNILLEESKIEEVLNINIKSILDRRLQTIVFRKGLARSNKQARQFIIHGHIVVGGRRVNVPSYLVPLKEEMLISFSSKSKLNNEDHPERLIDKEKLEIVNKDKQKGVDELVEEIIDIDANKKNLDDIMLW